MFRLLCLVFVGIFISPFQLSSWEKKPMDLNKCRHQGITDRKCRMDSERDNLLSFECELSPEACRIFNAFPRSKKERAMWFADGSSMTPEEAVELVKAGE